MTTIQADIEAVVTSMQIAGEPYFTFGHRKEIANELTNKDADPVFKKQKYPLILLAMDVPETTQVGGLVRYKLNLAIVDYTDKNYTIRDRYSNVITPILQPLYVRFMIALRRSGLFIYPLGNVNGWPKHVKIDRPFWGTQDSNGNVKQMLNDPLDAIEIIDLEVSRKFRNCFTGVGRVFSPVFGEEFG